MVSSSAVIILLIALPAVILGHQSDDCFCISKSYGCKEDLVQTGLCSKRCCTDTNAIDPETGEKKKRQCVCRNASECPDEFPNSIGVCNDLVECCPKPKHTEF